MQGENIMMSDFWSFIQTQVFQMEWLYELVNTLLLYAGMSIETRVGASIHFFFYDLIKIFLLLIILIFILSYVQSYFPPERTKRILGKYKGFNARIIAALLGTVTPFCSCSSIPIFIGFTSAGLPVGITFSFLISSPLVDLASLLLLGSIFGWKIAVAYMLVGVILAVVGGTYIEKMGMEKYVEDFAKKSFSIMAIPKFTQKERVKYAYTQSKETARKVFIYIVVGVFIGALIHNWIPSTWVESILGDSNPFSVITATIIAIPMYGDIFGTIPIAEALFAKGVGIGTVLTFMMGVTALSLPSLIMIKKVIQPRLFFTFTGIICIGIICIGYLFNLLQQYLI